MQELASLREQVTCWHEIEGRTRDTLELLELAQAESDDDLVAELARDAQGIGTDLDKLEFQLMLSGEHDRGNAIVAIHAGAGGTDSQDWSEMLLRMYIRWAETHGYRSELIDSLAGDEAGLKRAMLSIEGTYAYGYLRSERGVHRLVRLSPFDSNHRRHTSFSLVEVWPDIREEIEIEIRQEDLQIDVFSASGPGGQHMQKNATAVRITHEPSGIVIRCPGLSLRCSSSAGREPLHHRASVHRGLLGLPLGLWRFLSVAPRHHPSRGPGRLPQRPEIG